MKKSNAMLIMALGVSAILALGCLTGIPAWLMGNKALKQIEAGEGDPAEKNLIVAGQYCGMIATVLSICLGPIVFYAIVLPVLAKR